MSNREARDAKEALLTAECIREVLHYDQETGIFTRRVRTTNSMRIDDVAGGVAPDGYRRIRVLGHRYLAHRLAWLYVTGAWPKDQIDHKNRVKGDNRWDNLREATQSQNKANGYYRATGCLKRVCRHHGKWRAEVTVDGKSRSLGRFDDQREAALVAATAAYAVFGEFARPHWRDLLADMHGVAEP